ncbi:MAG: DoxX family membrane protein [Candidatus Marinimicrobia bacterium]|nr:DoxX family membrane protein [Candidatus Neomarinimicrobiota bacterium]
MSNYNKFVPLLLRIALGAVFIVHGYAKLTGMDGTIGFFGKIGIPLPAFSAWLVALVEFLGGISVLLGIFTRISAGLIAIVMVVAMITVKFAQGFSGGWEFDFVLFMMALALVIKGDGEFSLDKVVGK